MKNIFFVFIALVIAINIKAQDSNQCKNIAIDVIRMFQNNQPDSIYNMMDDKMQKAISPEQLSMIWPAFITNDGNFVKWENQKEKTFQGYLLIETNLMFERKSYTMRLAFDDETKISGLFFVPIRTYSVKDDLPANKSTAYWTEEPLKVKTGMISLPGVLCIPKNTKTYPIVVFVHGSGPNDMDETIGPNKIFADLAHALAEKGIASLRYDKRTYVIQQTGDTSIPYSGLENVVIEDAVAALDIALRTVPQGNKVFILGHSLGASLAPEIANRVKNLGGIIMLAGTPIPIEDEVLRQTKYLYKENCFSCKERKEYRDMKKRVENVKNIDHFLLLHQVPDLPLVNDTAFWRDVHHMNPGEELLKSQIPVLILQGERDYQVTMKSFEKWFELADGKKNIEFKSYPKLNHLFHESEGKSYPKEYSVQGVIPGYVKSDISLWILSKN